MNEDALVPVTAPCSEEFGDEVLAATTKLGRLGPDCTENNTALAAQMRTDTPGLCVVVGVEAIFIRRSDGRVEENHSCFFGNGSWTNSGRGKFIGCHTDGGPPPVTGCTAPLPDKDPSKLRIALHCAGAWCDGTLQTQGTCSYCAQIGMGEIGGTMRCGCPMRSECPGFKCEERSACEAYVGTPVWETKPAGRPVELRQDNPWVARCDGCTEMRVCIPGVVCSEWKPAP